MEHSEDKTEYAEKDGCESMIATGIAGPGAWRELPYPLPPHRGLILAHNARGQPFPERELHRWAAYSVRIFNCTKIDVLAWGAIPESVLSVVWYAREFNVPISLRTDGSAPPEGLARLASEGLEDVCLCPETLTSSSWLDWLDACRRLKLPVRLQLRRPDPGQATPEEWAARWSEAGVRTVHGVLDDPFYVSKPCPDAAAGRAVVEFINTLAVLLPRRGIDFALFGFPPELLTPEALNVAGDSGAYLRDHQQYDPAAYFFAQALYPRRPSIVRALLLLELKQRTVSFSFTDAFLSRMLYVYSRPLYNTAKSLSKLLRTGRARPGYQTRRLTEPAPPVSPESRRMSDTERQRALKQLCLRTGNDNAGFVAPGIRPRYYDRVDCAWLRRAQVWDALAREARDWERLAAPTRVFTEGELGSKRVFVIPEYGATAWLTFLSGERVSNIIDYFCPPFMISMTVGGGLAEAFGFRLTTSYTIMCPLVESRHTITLYVREDGQYVLLRDGRPIESVHRPGGYPAPLRISTLVELRLVVWDLEERISLSPLRAWKETRAVPVSGATPKYSVVIFCTRFARRLMPVLQSLVHQKGFDLKQLEVIVGYVPGMDATEDLLESLQMTHPELRIVHATFPAQNARSKGFVLNQCMSMAAGEWIILLDADILMPPWMFATMEQETEGRSFLFPKGRAKLSPQVTARILLGETAPWDEWEALLAAADLQENEAKGAPIGYCQCFRKQCLETVRYPEYEHFQGADFEFAMELRKHLGQEHRLAFPVLHLDHSGSQWLGAERHF